MKFQRAITIDDAPSSITDLILESLAQRGLTATFFCLGKNLEAEPEKARRMVKAGHLLANHGYDHQAFSSLGEAEGLAQIERTEALIEGIYRSLGQSWPRKHFRFPYGDKGGERKPAFQAVLRDRGYQPLLGLSITFPWYHEQGLDQDADIFWTFDTLDYRLADAGQNFSPRDFRAHILEGLGDAARRTSDEIILFHDHPWTHVVMPSYWEAVLDQAAP